MTFQIKKAVKYGSKLRAALIGISGSGKTYSALQIAKYLGDKICLIDTEGQSASKYADIFNFDTLPLETFSPTTYVEAIRFIESQGYEVCIIDSLSHAWIGKEGALEQVDKAAKRSQSNNSYVAWREVTPKHNELVDTMIRCKMHLIVTMRAKQEYVLDKDEKTGKTSVRKVGLAPIQREGLEYEFDVVGDMDLENNYIISKTRCSKLNGQIINKPSEELANILIEWLDGEIPPPEPEPTTNPKPTKGKAKTKKQLEAGATNCKTLDELRDWYTKLPVDEKKLALAAKDKRKTELEKQPEPKVNNVMGSVKMLNRLLNEITILTPTEQLQKIDRIIDEMEDENKKFYCDEFQKIIDELKIDYKITAFPF